MNSLLKADFYAMKKSKLTYVLLGICIGLPILTVVLYILVNKLSEDTLESLISGKSIMFSTFSLTNNFGLILPIFVGIFTTADIRHGTIRNKVIIGQSRTKIYFSHLIVATTLCVTMILISFIVSALGGIAAFGYGQTFDKAEAWAFAKSFIAGITTFMFVSSLSTFLALSSKSTPLTIILTIVVCIGLGLLSSLSLVLFVPEKYSKFFFLIPTYASSVAASSSLMSLLDPALSGLSNESFILGLVGNFAFIAINTVAGIFVFKKKDLK